MDSLNQENKKYLEIYKQEKLLSIIWFGVGIAFLLLYFFLQAPFVFIILAYWTLAFSLYILCIALARKSKKSDLPAFFQIGRGIQLDSMIIFNLLFLPHWLISVFLKKVLF
ncbi:MAG: hypothetical protein HY918_02320 [Candidatus Doudnabacteria bacterium]|nr:hypothetical protein [Candidatus Doudnabacteria bacterium]